MAVGGTWGGVGRREVRLSQGTVRYVDAGEGPVLLFIHGVFVNGQLWRDVIPRLSDRFRCIAPDLPLGAHSPAMEADADLSPPGIVRLVSDLVEALDLRDVTLIGNDTGGALCQIAISRHPDWVRRLVLTTCDAYDAFFPAVLRPLTLAPRVPGLLGGLAALLRMRPAQHAFVATVARRRPEDEVLDSVFRPFTSDPAVRRDVGKFLVGVSNGLTLNASAEFPRFEKPVLILWGERDLFFPLRYGERLARDFPQARLERVAHTRTFIPLDRPDLLSSRVSGFASEQS